MGRSNFQHKNKSKVSSLRRVFDFYKGASTFKIRHSLVFLFIFISYFSICFLSYQNNEKFALIPNSHGSYQNKFTQVLNLFNFNKAEAIIFCPVGECRPTCLCDAYDGMGGTPGECGYDNYTCNAGNVGGETGTSWICYSIDGGDDAYCAISTVDGVCSSAHWMCVTGTEYSPARYTGPDGYQWRCDGLNGGSSATCNEYFPKITISASPSDVPYYDYTYLTWSTQYANSCTVKLNGGTWQVTGTSGSGVTYGRLIGDNSWTATCTGSAGTKTATFGIRTKPQVTISANTTSIPAGNAVTISWSSVFTSQVTCSVTKNGAAWTSSTNTNLASNATPFAATNNSATDNPTSSATYVATCTTPSGASQSASVAVSVVGQVGSCGSTSMTCSVGTPTALSLSGSTHYWYCTGPNGGGTSPTCSAPAPQNAVCSATHWGCSVGTNSPTSNNSFNGMVYAWKCAGVAGGTGTTCYEYVPTNGECNNSSNNSCNVGNLNDIADSGSQYLWQCTGFYGGSTASCALNKPISGSCGGSINGCSSGSLSDTADDASNNNWQCVGSYGGSTASCSIAKTNGSCGGYNLCTSGTFSDVTDDATYGKWQCLGINNGTTASCQLAKVNGQCNLTQNVINSCTSGTFQDNTDNADYVQWYCNGSNGGTHMGCAKQIMKGACGSSINTCLWKPITAGITADGAGEFVDLADDASTNKWRCNGVNTGPSIDCTYPKTNGSCGSSVNSCTTGTLSDVADDASYKRWNCVGSSNGTTANCQFVQPPVVSVTANSANGGTSGRAYSGEAATLTWTASNSPTGCTIYRNGSSLATVAGSATSYTTPGLSDGNTTFRVDCSNAGGTGTGNTVTYVVPTVPTGLSASCGAPGSTGNFSWTLPSGFTGSYFRYCKGASCDYTTACNPAKTPPEGSCVNGTYSSISQATTPNNTYSWYIHTMDVSGNWSSAVSGSNVYCTPAVPNTPSIGNPTPATVGIGMNASFVISGTDSVGMNVAYEIDADNNGTVDVTSAFGASGWNYTWVNQWAGAGSKTFQVRTKSTDGRVSGWVQKTINITGACVPSFSVSGKYGTNAVVDYNDSLNITWSSTGAASGVLTKNGSSFNTNISGTVSSGALTSDTTFINICTNAAGQTAQLGTTVDVYPAFSLSANTPAACGTDRIISWSSNYASSCNIKKDGVAWKTGVSNTGVSAGVQITSPIIYAWECFSSGFGIRNSGSYYIYADAINGVCNATNNLCTAGTYQDATDDATYSKWSCLGGCGGTTANCQIAKINGVCGATNNTCTAGALSDTADNGTQYLWNCNGANGGTTASCSLNKPVPANPTISGPTITQISVSENYNFQATDSLGSQVKYEIDWDNNGTVDQTSALGASGWTYTAPNNWGGAGAKTFKSRSVSSEGRYSAWASYTVNVYAQCAPTITMTGLQGNTQVTSTYLQGVIDYNKAANIAWNSTDAKSASVLKNNVAWRSTITGSETTGALTSDTTYWNQCINMSGSGQNNMIQLIKVYPGVFEPGAFTVTPPAFCGDTAKVSWNVQNAAGGCALSFDGVAKGGTGSSGSNIVSDPIYSSTQINLLCTSVSSSGRSTTTNVAPPARDGVCGTTENTCSAGTAIAASDDASSWSWTCSGGCGGNYKSCSKLKPPLAPTITGPTDGAASTDYSFVISGTDPVGQQIKYAIDWDNNDTVDGTTALGASGWNYTWTNNWAGSGVKNFKVKTISSDGRESGWSSTYNFNVYGPPVLTFTATPVVDYGTVADFTFTETGASPIMCVFSVNGVDGPSIGSQNYSTARSDVLYADTTYKFTCTNVGGSSSITRVVKVRPKVTLTATPANIAYNVASTLSWSSNNAASCNVTKAGSAWQTGVSNAGISSGLLTSNTTFVATCTSGSGTTQNATTTVAVAALNGVCLAAHYTCTAGTSANNVNGAMKWTWNCNGANGGTNASCSQDKPVPNIPTITGPTQGKINTTYNFNITATNPSGDPIRYAIDWDNSGTVDGYLPASGTATSGTTLVWSNQWAGSGVKTFKVRTETNGGPISAWVTYNINLFGAPSVSWTPATANVTYGSRLTFGYSSTDSTYCNVYSTLTGDPNTYEATPFWSNASTTFTWINEGPYYQNFKRKAVCYNPFGDSAVEDIVVNVSQNDASCVKVTNPYYLVPGEKFSPKIEVNNIGDNVWGNVSPFLHNAFIKQNHWGANRYLPLVNAPVNPGSHGLFYGVLDILTAPAIEGYYDFSAQPVQGIEAGGESFYGETCTSTTPHLENKILVKAPTLGIGDGDVDLESLSFPMSYVVGDPPIIKTVTVRNRGGGVVSGSISIPEGKFACVDGCNFALGPGGTSSVSVSFQSSATGTFVADMAANSNVGIKNLILTAGTGAKFEIKYSPLDFGAVPVGKTKFLNLTIKNNSLAQPSGPFDFSPAAPFECISGCSSANMLPNTTRTIRIKFTPTDIATSSIAQTINLPTTPSTPIVLIGQGLKAVFKVEEK